MLPTMLLYILLLLHFSCALDTLKETREYGNLILQNKEFISRDLIYNDGMRMDLVEGSSLTSQLYQKSLELFTLTDMILTSDIEGNINAINRNTGEIIWTLVGGEPVVSIKLEDDLDGKYRGKISTPHPFTSTFFQTASVGNKLNDYSNTTASTNFGSFANQRRKNKVIWIVEPYGDGSLYQFTKESGLQKLPVSIKEFIMNSPFTINDEFVYTGSRHSGIVKINALTGTVVESFGVGFENEGRVHDEDELEVVSDEDEEIDDYFTYKMNYDTENNKEKDHLADEGPIITIGKTIYDLTIYAKNSTSWNITYVQWGPNNLHSNLMNQNLISRDNLYIQPFHDKSLLAMNSDAKMVKWVANLPFTTINVFDIFQDTDESEKFVVLPHPIDHSSQSIVRENGGSTYIDKTNSGSWFALSESHYPSLVRSAPIAKYITNKRWRDESVLYNNDLFSISIKGVHDDSIRDKMDKSGSHNEKDVALYNPIRLPTAIEKPIQKTYRKDGDDSQLPDSAKFYEDQGNEKSRNFNTWEGSLKLPTSTYKTSFLKEILFRVLENVVVAMLCVFIVFILNRFGIINLSNFQQSVESKIDDTTNTETLVNDEVDDETTEKVVKNKKSVTINEEVEILRSDDEIEVDELESDDKALQKKKRKRGSRAGRKHKRKDVNPANENMSVSVESNEKELTETVTKISNNLSVTEEILGFGSHGTIVFKGYFENRPVAVKRMLIDFYDVASHEISLLQESDDHSNVIRYFCSQEYNKFLYIALELCSASLEDVIEKRNIQVKINPQQILWQIANGVYHLHSLKIVHRDIKPQNILVVKPRKNDGIVRFLISDFGLCKRLEADQSSFRGTSANAAGTSGWRAPELLVEASRGYTNDQTTVRLTRALDIFSTGCVFYYVLTGGRHPFGDRFSREGEIIKGNFNLDEVNYLGDSVEIRDLIALMINRDPLKRPDIVSVMKHPYFWSTKHKMEFLLKVSDRFEIERRDPPSELLMKFETISNKVLGEEGWFKKFDENFINNLGKYRKYNPHKVMDLLRAIRNKYHHYQDLPVDLSAEIGSLDEGFYWFFAKKFPQLLLAIYENCKILVGQEDDMKAFYS